jgi:hypothetical protein
VLRSARRGDPEPLFGWSGRHFGSNDYRKQEQRCDMPSLIRFLVVVGIIGAAVIGGLYVMAVFFEPAQRETATPLPGVKVRR